MRAIGKPNLAVLVPMRRSQQAAIAGAAAGADAGDRRDGRHAALLQHAEHAVVARLVVDRVLRRRERAELVDVRSRGERLVARAGEDQDLDGAILVRLLADLGDALVHLERERVARLRPVEGDAADAVAHVEKDVVVLFGHVFLRRRCL